MIARNEWKAFALGVAMTGGLFAQNAVNHNPYFEVGNMRIGGSNFVMLPGASSTSNPVTTQITLDYRGDVPDQDSTKLRWTSGGGTINIPSLSMPATWSGNDQTQVDGMSLNLEADSSASGGDTDTLEISQTSPNSGPATSKVFTVIQVEMDESELERGWFGVGSMPYAFALNEERDLTVTISPSPLPSGASVTFVTSVADERGDISVQGNDTLSQSGTIKIKANGLSDPYKGESLRVFARLGGASGPTLYATPAFGVTALPNGWSESDIGKTTTSTDYYTGLRAQWQSDTADLDDLTEVLFREVITQGPKSASFSGDGDVAAGPTSGESMENGQMSDTYSYRINDIDLSGSGSSTIYQTFEILDRRSSSNPQWIEVYSTELEWSINTNVLSFDRYSDYHNINLQW